MAKWIIIIALSCNYSIFSQIRFGLDVSGDYKLSYEGESETYDVENGVVIGYDHVTQNKDKIQLGVGGEFMLNRGIEEWSDGKASFHSVYGFGKYMLDEKLYGYGRVGYNFHTGDDDYTECPECTITLGGGLMFAFGGGYALTPTIRLEGQLVSHSGDATFSIFGFDDTTYKIKYSRTSIGIIFTP